VSAERGARVGQHDDAVTVVRFEEQRRGEPGHVAVMTGHHVLAYPVQEERQPHGR
jgi:hypothetical protein